MTTEQATHRHELHPGYPTITYADGNPDYIDAIIYDVDCEALEPWHDPHTERVAVVIPDGDDTAVCPECRETFTVQ